MPRRTARFRLTLLYGGLFLACGAILLVVTYLLVRHAINPDGHINRENFPPSDITVSSGPLSKEQLPDGQLPDLAQLETALGKEIAASDLRQVLIDAPIALAIVTVVALGLGWLAAGRVLRPLAVINATARRISASNLSQRLALRGPDDELKALGDTLDDLFARLEASFDAQRNFVANASHELRTPLTRERAMLQVALDDPGTSAETWRAVATGVLASNAEQESLIEALLALAGSQAGPADREVADLAAITGNVLDSAAPEAQRRGVSVTAALSPAVLVGDKVLIERLVANLVANAIRHNTAGGEVEVGTTTRDGHAVLKVGNTGVAIPADEVGRLFQPFVRLGDRRAGHDGGHGLGLSIVQAIATAHAATVDARPRTGGGLSVEVTFPCPRLEY
ncbi:ATP-binding protein [Hamadaea sp.]|uniref:sensor histidine kinase n=1 Tax=Hamadaea sp. TaxID=2024425 RepID=UPI0025B95F5E|nr:ATP-binding protein [Hamadaea sp.]